jgi:hypothetical protein
VVGGGGATGAVTGAGCGTELGATQVAFSHTNSPAQSLSIRHSAWPNEVTSKHVAPPSAPSSLLLAMARGYFKGAKADKLRLGLRPS